MSEEKKKKIIGLRVSNKTVEEVRIKTGETSLEFQFLQTLIEANVPFSVVAHMLNEDQNHVRDCITYRKRFPEELKERVCVKFKKVLEVALDEGLLPCSDVACVQPILTLTLRVMAAGVMSR